MSKRGHRINGDDSDLIDRFAKKYFSEIEHSVLHVQQVLFDLQNEYYKGWKNSVNSNILLYKDFVDASKYGPDLSDAAKSLFEKYAEDALRFRTLYKKLTISNIESMKQNAKIINENAESIANMNRKNMNRWMSAFFPNGV